MPKIFSRYKFSSYFGFPLRAFHGGKLRFPPSPSISKGHDALYNPHLSFLFAYLLVPRKRWRPAVDRVENFSEHCVAAYIL